MTRSQGLDVRGAAAAEDLSPGDVCSIGPGAILGLATVQPTPVTNAMLRVLKAGKRVYKTLFDTV